METLKRIQEENSYNLFYDTVLERKKKLPEVSEPALKRKTQAHARLFFGKAPAEHPLRSRDHY